MILVMILPEPAVIILRDDRARHQERARKVCAKDRVPILKLHVDKGTAPLNPCVVDEYVDWTRVG